LTGSKDVWMQTSIIESCAYFVCNTVYSCT